MNKTVRLVTVYKRPNIPLSVEDINLLLDTKCKTTITSDLNSKHYIWNSLSCNQAGILLTRYIDSRYDIAVVTPSSTTDYPDNPNNQLDILDIVIMKTESLNYHLKNLSNELSSDYTPIQLDIQTRASKTLPPASLE